MKKKIRFTYNEINNLLQQTKCPETRSPREFRVTYEYVIVHQVNEQRNACECEQVHTDM